jgi:cation/acetate symporter
VFFSPVVSGKVTPGVDGAPDTTTSLFPIGTDFSWFPLDNPGLVSIPFGFFCGWLGTILSKEYNADKYAEMEVRSLTGAGSEKAIAH